MSTMRQGRSFTHPNIGPEHDNDGFRETTSGAVCEIIDRMYEQYEKTGIAPPLSASSHMPRLFRLAHAIFLHHVGLLPLPQTTSPEMSS